MHWFRKGLRLHDNPALLEAIERAAGASVFPVFVLDTHFVDPSRVGPLRMEFLLQSLRALDEGLRARGNRLYVLRGRPEEALPAAWSQWGVRHLTFEEDTEPYARDRDATITKLARAEGLSVSSHASHTLHRLSDYACKGPIPTSMTQFQKRFAQMGPVPVPVPAPEAVTSGSGVGTAACDDKHLVPASLTAIGYPEDVLTGPSAGPPGTTRLLYPGGEAEGLRRLEAVLKKKAWVARFDKPKTSPNALEPSTTVISPYLKFGCVSVRQMYHGVSAIIEGARAAGKETTRPPVSMQGQLMWREFNYLLGSTTPNWDRIEDNPMCRTIPWDNDAKLLKAWEEGRTGFPFIDAIMVQLRTEGWIHHLARHMVACFLTRGDLFQSWTVGARAFDRMLLDADWSVNNFNWMWLSCSGFFYQYFRCYSPVAFGKKTDKNGDYIRRYLPVLRKLPAKYIYEPWTAPKEVQRGCGCVIGRDYPAPIVDHKVISKTNMGRIAKAYEAYKKGPGKRKAEHK